MRPYYLAVVIVSVLLGVTAQQVLGGTRERFLGPNGEIILVELEKDAETYSEITALFQIPPDLVVKSQAIDLAEVM